MRAVTTRSRVPYLPTHEEVCVISFELSEEQDIARAAAASLARSTLGPAARAADEAARIQPAVLDTIWALGIVQTAADLAVEQPTVLNVLVLEEFAAGDATLAAAIAAAIGFVKAVAEQGSDRQRHKVLPSFLTDVPQFAPIVELAAVRTSDGYLLNGHLPLVPLTGRSPFLLALAECDGCGEAFIVPRDAPGITITTGQDVLGLRGLAWASITLKDLAVPASMRLGEAGGADIQRIRDAARIALTAILSGLSRAVFDFSLPYAQTRIVHGEAIARKQSVAFKLADMHTAIDAMRWMGLKAAAELDSKAEATRSARLAQLYANDAAMRIADEGVQIFGGHGFVRDLPLEMWYRNARSLSVLDGLIGA